MIKRINKVLLCCFLCLLLSACGSANTYVSYTYSVDTGDSVKIKFDTSNGYDFASDLPFVIMKDGTTLSQGMFITEEDYSQYVVAVENDENAKVIASSEQDGNEYIFWSYNDNEYNYAILIKDSNTGVILGNVVSEESAKECFARLEITIEEN